MCPRNVVRGGQKILCPVSLQGCYLDRVLQTAGRPSPIPFFQDISRSIPTQFSCAEITGTRARSAPQDATSHSKLLVKTEIQVDSR
jgi:hypothetical protein